MQNSTLSKLTLSTLFLFLIVVLPAQLQAQKKIAATAVNRNNTASLSRVFKNYSLFNINTPELAQHAKLNSKGTVNVKLEFAGLPAMNIALRENDILSSGYKLTADVQQRRKVFHKPNAMTYKGKLVDDINSSVYLTISDKTIYGFIKGNGKEYFIEPLRYFNKLEKNNSFVLYETKDVVASSGISCGVRETEKKARETTIEQNVLSRIAGVGCAVMDVAIAADESMFLKYGSVEAVEEHNISIMNTVVGIFGNTQIGNIYLDLKIAGQYIATSADNEPLLPAYIGNGADTILSNFRNWGEAGNFGFSYDLAQIFTSKYSGGTDGLAMDLGTTCTSARYQLVVEHSESGGYTAAVTAHETGHSLGAQHPDDLLYSPFIMGYGWSEARPATSFSSSSISEMNNYISRPEVTCLSPCDAPVAEISASAMTICTGGTITFTDISAGPVTQRSWSFQDGTPDSSANKTEMVSFSQPGTKAIQLTVSNEKGSSTVTKTIVVVDPSSEIQGTLSASHTEVCSNVDLTLTYSGNLPGSVLEYYDQSRSQWSRWWQTIEDQPIIVESWMYSPQFDRFRVKSPLGDCFVYSNTVEINYLPLPQPIITGDNRLCLGEATVLQVADADSSAAPYLNYQWNPGGEITHSVTVSPTAPSRYSVKVTDENGCTKTASKYVFVSALPVVPTIQASLTQLICAGTSTTLSFMGTKTIPGCTNATYPQWPTTTFSFSKCDGTYELITNQGYQSEYSRVNVVASKYYAFKSTSISGDNLDDLITVSTADGTTILATGLHSAIWKASYTGQVRFYTHGGGCASKAEDRKRLAACSDSPTAFGSFLWMPGGQTTDAITVIPTSNTLYSLTFTDAMGCSVMKSMQVNVGIGAAELSTTNIGCNSATFNWTSQLDPTQWQLEYKTTSNGGKWINVPIANASTRSVTITGLKPDQNYNWHIRAKCGKAWTPYSDAVAFKTLPICVSESSTLTSSALMTTDIVSADKITVYPNPSEGLFNVELQGKSMASTTAAIRLTDITGLTVHKQDATLVDGVMNAEIQMPASAPAGVYVMHVVTGGQYYQVRLIYVK